MNLGFLKKKSLHWCFVDCVLKQRYDIAEFPCTVGTRKACYLDRDKTGQVTLHKTDTALEVLCNGVPLNGPKTIEPGQDYSLKIAEQFLLLRGDEDLAGWIGALNFQRWIVQDLAANEILTTLPFEGIPAYASANQLDGIRIITTVEGARQAFYLKDVLAELPGTANGAGENVPTESPAAPAHPAAPAPPAQPDVPMEEDTQINTVSGEFTCPHCWQHFDRGDVMWIAKHPNLRDPDLGEDFALRFFPTSFDEYGKAVDAMGVRCSEMACPNCRSRLPPQFLDLETHILSIVGAPSAGKSYYLTSVINELEETLPRHFSLAFKDSDASGNAIVSDMRAKLFSDSSNPVDIALDKTVPGGEMFRTWQREGREVKLPKPFTYLVSPFTPDRDGERTLHLVFYDNAGEQFEPAERSESGGSSDLDSTHHLASSSAILFLYDPASNVRFRKMLAGSEDPQLSDERFLRLNRQDNIIAEMRNRIMSELNVDANARIDTPLLMLIGKCDLWESLLEEPIEDPVSDRGIDFEVVNANSRKVRDFLMKTSPGVVANAESISNTVVYFPVSPIGHSPRKFTVPGESVERIGPVPGKVAPRFPEVPVLWTLARLHPEMFGMRKTEEAAG